MAEQKMKKKPWKELIPGTGHEKLQIGQFGLRGVLTLDLKVFK